MNRKGFGLVELMFVTALLAVVMTGSLQFFSQMNRAQRGLASTGELEDVYNTIRLILSSQAACDKSGLTGVGGNPFRINPDSPQSTSVALYNPGSSGPGSVLVADGTTIPGVSWNATRLRFESMAQTGTDGASNPVYLSTLRLDADRTDQATTAPHRMRSFSVNLTLDKTDTTPDKRVIACQAGANGGSTENSFKAYSGNFYLSQDNPSVSPAYCYENCNQIPIPKPATQFLSVPYTIPLQNFSPDKNSQMRVQAQGSVNWNGCSLLEFINFNIQLELSTDGGVTYAPMAETKVDSRNHGASFAIAQRFDVAAHSQVRIRPRVRFFQMRDKQYETGSMPLNCVTNIMVNGAIFVDTVDL